MELPDWDIRAGLLSVAVIPDQNEQTAGGQTGLADRRLTRQPNMRPCIAKVKPHVLYFEHIAVGGHGQGWPLQRIRKEVVETMLHCITNFVTDKIVYR